jgi:hypothetical protein
LLSFVPLIGPEVGDSFEKILVASITRPEPIASIAAEFGIRLSNEIVHPGSVFYDCLIHALQFNQAFENGCPVIYEAAACPYLPNLLYATVPGEESLKACLGRFIAWFLQNYFKLDAPLAPEQLSAVSGLFSLEQGDLDAIGRQMGWEVSEDGFRSSGPQFSLPTIRPILVKLAAVEFHRDSVVPMPASRASLFLSSRNIVLKRLIFDPVGAFLRAGTSITPVTEIGLIVLGQDTFFGTLFSSILATSRETPALSQAFLKFFFIPTGPSAIADFIAGFDPVYRIMVSQLYTTATTIGPVMDEAASDVMIPSVEPPGDNAELNVWFGDRSPSALVQLGIQHYLYFAREFVDLHVWQCALRFSEERLVVVPFFVSVKLSLELKRVFEVEAVDAARCKVRRSFEKIPSIAIWNARRDLNVFPNDGWLLVETERESLMILAAKIATKGQAFMVTVDEREYGPVESIALSYLPDDREAEEPLKVRLATFVPFYSA